MTTMITIISEDKTKCKCGNKRSKGSIWCGSCRGRRYREQNPDAHRRSVLKQKFGITLEEYEHFLHIQNSVCAICKSPETATRKGNLRLLCVDHDHETGEVRGLLCNKCNIALGQMDDSPNLLREAAKYLEAA